MQQSPARSPPHPAPASGSARYAPAARRSSTGWPEGARLIAYRPAYGWIDILRVANLNIGLACALGFAAAWAGGRALIGKPLRAHDVKPLERARTDTFGHADLDAHEGGRRAFRRLPRAARWRRGRRGLPSRSGPQCHAQSL